MSSDCLRQSFCKGPIEAKERRSGKSNEHGASGGAPFTDISEKVMNLNINTKAKLKGVSKSDKGYVFTMVAKVTEEKW